LTLSTSWKVVGIELDSHPGTNETVVTLTVSSSIGWRATLPLTWEEYQKLGAPGIGYRVGFVISSMKTTGDSLP
jgi:hypothetical protein